MNIMVYCYVCTIVSMFSVAVACPAQSGVYRVLGRHLLCTYYLDEGNNWDGGKTFNGRGDTTHARCMCCKVHMLQITHAARCTCCKSHMLQSAHAHVPK